jgi:hypothetical protein
MLTSPTILAHALTSLTVVTTQPVTDKPPAAIQLPSDGMRRAMHVIRLSEFSVIAGPQFEGVLHGALFRSTEHLYDL